MVSGFQLNNLSCASTLLSFDLLLELFDGLLKNLVVPLSQCKRGLQLIQSVRLLLKLTCEGLLCLLNLNLRFLFVKLFRKLGLLVELTQFEGQFTDLQLEVLDLRL